MTEIRGILLGVVLGGVITYAFLDSSSSKPETIIKTQECSKVKEHIAYNEIVTTNKTQIKEERNDRETKKVKERQKTPDELYEEQHEEQYVNDYEDSSENIENDDEVVSLEQQQAERELPSSNKVIDRSIIPLELEEVENDNSSKLSKEELEEDIPPLTPMIEEIIEVKEVVSEELRDIEEYGDNSDTSDESDMPL